MAAFNGLSQRILRVQGQPELHEFEACQCYNETVKNRQINKATIETTYLKKPSKGLKNPFICDTDNYSYVACFI